MMQKEFFTFKVKVKLESPETNMEEGQFPDQETKATLMINFMKDLEAKSVQRGGFSLSVLEVEEVG